MGRGDRRSRKGKIWLGSFGKTRLRKRSKPVAAQAEAVVAKSPAEKKKAPAKKAAAAK
ncbi:MAG: 30S ribosomal protein THX [Bacteroidetes bacterium]|jgi:30S ribosomal protein S31|nr:30S ribosomal protein THX [Bacteroidota bacterium]